MSEIDVKDVETLKYNDPTEGQNKITLQIRRFPGQAPAQITVDHSWTVAHVEQKLAKQVWKTNPNSVRLTLYGQPLPKNTTIANLSPQIEGQVLDVVPEHPVGVRSLPAGLPFTIPNNRYQYTNYDRIRTELQDLPFKPGYNKTFKVTVKSENVEDWIFSILNINSQKNWYKYQLILVGYPKYITGYFKGAIPPCPIHGGKHPHIYQHNTFCWEIEKRWKPGMMLYEDYIMFIFKVLENPQHHLGCGYR